MDNFKQVIEALQKGEVIAYPTEGVFGVGCDPDNPQAIEKLLQLKQRPVEKGLILIAADYEQVQSYVDDSQLSETQKEAIFSTWPGPVTWVMPVKKETSNMLTGQFESIAVRITDHPLVRKLCSEFGKPITSTSANLTGEPPCRTTEDVYAQLGTHLTAILEGKTGGRDNPTEIRDARSGQTLRQG